MWLVICEPGDTAALWAYQGLSRRGLDPLELISPASLTCSLRWEHRITDSGVSTAIKLASGRELSSATVRGILNRAYNVPSSLWRNAAENDKRYVEQELFAFFLSWLHALPCPVINRPTPLGLSGQWRPESEWVWLAAQAGLPTPVFRQTNEDWMDEAKGQRRLLPVATQPRTVIVAGDTVTGLLVPPNITRGCRKLSELSATALLGVDFIDDRAGPWTFAGATPLPELRVGGETLLDALAATLRSTSDST